MVEILFVQAELRNVKKIKYQKLRLVIIFLPYITIYGSNTFILSSRLKSPNTQHLFAHYIFFRDVKSNAYAQNELHSFPFASQCNLKMRRPNLKFRKLSKTFNTLRKLQVLNLVSITKNILWETMPITRSP